MFRRGSSFWYWLAVAAVFILTQTTMTSAATPVYLMAAMGDSITAGFFADTSLDDFLEELSRDTGRVLEADPGSGLFEHKDSFSWASGGAISSHIEKLRNVILKQDPDAQVKVLNFASSGAVAQDMPDEAQAIVQAMQEGKYRAVKYVTLFIGANDACSTQTATGTPDESMTHALAATFEALSQINQSEPIRVLVVGLPQIPYLAKPDIGDATTILGMSCHFFRDDLLHACSSLMDWENVGDYLDKLAIVMDKNNVLQAAAEAANRSFPNLRVHYTSKLWNVEIKPEQLAIDCFHPGRQGQQFLSDELWAEQPWYR